MARTGSGARKAASVPGGTTVRPPGLSRSLAILATVLLDPSPIEHEMPSSLTRRAMRSTMAMGLSAAKRPGVTSKNASSMETLVDERGLIGDDGHHARAHLPIPVEMAARPYGVWAQSLCLGRGHRRAHAEGPRLVGGGGNDAALLGQAADDDGLAAPGGVVELLDARKERIEVHEPYRRARPRTEERLHAGGRTVLAIVCLFVFPHSQSIASQAFSDGRMGARCAK